MGYPVESGGEQGAGAQAFGYRGLEYATAAQRAVEGAAERLRASLPEGDPRHPRFIDAVIADARLTAAYRGNDTSSRRGSTARSRCCV